MEPFVGGDKYVADSGGDALQSGTAKRFLGKVYSM